MNRNAVILVDKASGITSFDCLGRIKRLINKKTGHCGTLDKFAHGLMIVLCGSYTKLVPVFMGMDKTYEALIEFGKSTDTLDPEGEIIETGEIPDFETVEAAVSRLVGYINQVPPAYSAIHVNGKRSYQLARLNEDMPQLEPRHVTIHEASIISYEAPFLKVRLHVSKGTYVRSYARDLGHLCNSCAYVKELYRTAIGPFKVGNAVRYDDAEALKAIADSTDDGLDLIGRIPYTSFVTVDETEAFKLSNGAVPYSVRGRLPKDNVGFVVFMNQTKGQSKAVCIYSVAEGRIICQVRGES